MSHRQPDSHRPNMLPGRRALPALLMLMASFLTSVALAPGVAAQGDCPTPPGQPDPAPCDCDAQTACPDCPDCGASGGIRNILWLEDGSLIDFLCPPGFYVPTPGFGQSVNPGDCIPIREFPEPNPNDPLRPPEPIPPADDYVHGDGSVGGGSPTPSAYSPDDRSWPPECPPEQAGGCASSTESYTVHPLSGDFAIDSTDMVVRGLDGTAPVVIHRNYASRTPHESAHFGPGWRGLYDIRLWGWQRGGGGDGRSWTNFKLQWPNRRSDIFSRIVPPYHSGSCQSVPPPEDWRWANNAHRSEIEVTSDPATWDGTPANLQLELRLHDGTTWTFQTIRATKTGSASWCPEEITNECDGDGRRILACGIEAQISKITDRFGNETRFVYNSSPGRERQLEQIIDNRNRVTTIQWQSWLDLAQGGSQYRTWRVTAVTAPDGRSVQYDYWLPLETNLDGHPATGYLLKRVTDPEGRQREYHYQSLAPVEPLDNYSRPLVADNILRVQDSQGQALAVLDYDTDDTWHPKALQPGYFPIPESGEPARGGSHALFQHSFDRVLRYATPAQSGWGATNYYYEAVKDRDEYQADYFMPEFGVYSSDQIVKRTFVNDALGRVTVHNYSKRNNLLELHQFTGFAPDPDAQTQNSWNKPTVESKKRSTDPNKYVTSHLWDQLSRPLRTTLANGTAIPTQDDWTTHFGHARGRYGFTVTGMTNALGNRVGYRHYTDPDLPPAPLLDDPFAPNIFNLITRVIDAEGHAVEYDYRPTDGALVAIVHSEPNTREDFTHSASGQLLSRLAPEDEAGRRRLDRWRYHDDPAHPWYGWLESKTVDEGGLELTTRYEYDPAGNVTARVTPEGHRWEALYNEVDQLTYLRSPELRPQTGVHEETWYRYDHRGNLKGVDRKNADENGSVRAELPLLTTEYERDPSGRIAARVETVDPSTVIRSEIARDLAGQVIAERSPLGCVGDATVCADSDPDAQTLHEYDARGMLFETRVSYEHPLTPGVRLDSTVRNDYNALGFLERTTVEATGEQARVTTRVVDDIGRVTELHDPMGNVLHRSYDKNNKIEHEWLVGEVIDIPGAAGNVLLYDKGYGYDHLGRRRLESERVFDPLSYDPLDAGTWHSRDVTYDLAPNGQIKSVSGPGPFRTSFEYDSAGRLWTETDASGNTVTHGYDDDGYRTTSALRAFSTLGGSAVETMTSIEPDPLGRALLTTYASDLAETRLYDAVGNLVETVESRLPPPDPWQRVSRAEFDGIGRPLTTTRFLPVDSPGADYPVVVTTQTWDANSRLTERVDPNGSRTRMRYTSIGLRYELEHEDLSVWQYEHDALGQVRSLLQPNGTEVVSTYDPLGRLQSQSATPGAGVSANGSLLEYWHDGSGQVRSAIATDPLGQHEVAVNRTFDSAGSLLTEELTTVIDGTARSWTSGFVSDTAGRRAELSYPSGRHLVLDYDETDGRLRHLDFDAERVASYEWLGEQLVHQRRLGNGVVEDWSVDPAGRASDLIALVPGCGSCPAIADYHVILDPWSARLELSRPLVARQTTHATDALNRLVVSTESIPLPGRASLVDYGLDPAGNRIDVAEDGAVLPYVMLSASDGQPDFEVNQYSATPYHDQTHDANGHLTRWHLGASDERYFAYDHRGLLASTTEAGTGIRFDYIYDPLGRRVATRSATDTVWIVWDGFTELEEYAAPHGAQPLLTASFVNGPGLEEIVLYSTPSTDTYLHQDLSGSVLAATDAGGALLARYDYTDYGVPTVYDSAGVPGAADPLGGRRLFHGKRLDGASSLYYSRLRMYDPLAGRFTTRDPNGIWFDSAALGNGYTFAAGNPTSFVDPTGEWAYIAIGISIAEAYLDQVHDWIMSSDYQDEIGYEGFGDSYRRSYYDHLASSSPDAAVGDAIGVQATQSSNIFKQAARQYFEYRARLKEEVFGAEGAERFTNATSDFSPQRHLIDSGVQDEEAVAPMAEQAQRREEFAETNGRAAGEALGEGAISAGEDFVIGKTVKAAGGLVGGVSSAVGKKTPTDRLKEQLFERRGKPKTATTLAAARDELAGATRGYDHVTKVRNAQRGLVNRIERIQRQLGHPSLGDAERAALQAELSEASLLLDYTEGFVPR